MPPATAHHPCCRTGQFREWRERRDLFRVNVHAGDQQAIRQAWQKFYFKGELADGKPAEAPHHVQKLRLPEPIDRRPQLDPVRQLAMPEKPRAPLSRVEGFVPVQGGRVWYQALGNAGGTPVPGADMRLLKRQPSGVFTSTSR